MSDLRKVAKLHLDIPHVDPLVRHPVTHTDKLPQAVHIDRALPVRIRLVALTGEGHKALRRNIVQWNTIEVRPVNNARHLEKGRAKAGRIALVVLRIEDAAQDIFELEVDCRLVLVGLEHYEVDAVIALGHVVHRAAICHPKLVAGGRDAVVFEFRHFEIFVHTQVADMRIALDVQIACHRAACFVEFLLQFAGKPCNLFDGMGMLGRADGRFHLPTRQPERRIGIRRIDHKFELVEMIFDYRLRALKVFYSYARHIL